MILYEYIERLNKWLLSTTFNDSSTIRTEKSDAGWTFHVKNMPTTSNADSTSTPDAYPCIITGGTTQSGYNVTIYANGFDKDSTGTGILQVLDLALSDDVPVGTRIMGHKLSVSITGGTE